MAGLGLYVHVPFCVRKCKYCDFCSVGIGESDETLTGRMVDCLIKELDEDIAETPSLKDEISTVFIGGGTPSILSVGQMEKLLVSINEVIEVGDSEKTDTEFTIECNPGTVDEEKLRLYKKYGVNRISFGLQSANDDELKTLGRIHTYDEFLTSYRLARKLGFDNISIDVMTAIPGQTKDSLRNTLDEVIRLEPEHISAYSLIIEEGTPFFDMYSDKPPIDEETDRKLFEMTHEMLTVAGYLHYEVSNYAKKGHACRHNMNYWRRGNYIGIGPAASSHMDGTRKTNTKDLLKYMKCIESGDDPSEETENLTKDQMLTEAVYLGLRTSEGIRFDNLLKEFDIDFRELVHDGFLKDDIEMMKKKEYLIVDDEGMKLTPAGWWISDSIIAKLIEEL